MKLNSILSALISGFIFLYVFAGQNFLFAQARIMMGATATYINISGGAYLVVGDATTYAAPNTITRSAGWIISEGDGTVNNRIKWYIGNAPAANTYTVPFGRGATNYIPLTFTIGTAGTAGKAFVFSTYRTADCINSANLPTTGTNPPVNYYSSAIGGDASAYGVDRFWEIDAATSYTATTHPDLSSLILTYIDGATSEVTGIPTGTVTCSNSIIESNLQAQRWNLSGASPGVGWESGVFLKGTSDVGNNNVTLTGAAIVSGANDLTNSRWWTLIDKNIPLPVELLRFSAECNREDVVINWSTASEQNSDYFTVERSQDGTNFQSVTTVLAAGNSSTVRNYSAVDADPYPGVSYYSLYETDLDGKRKFFGPITINCLPGISIITIYPNPAIGDIHYQVSVAESAQVTMKLIDVLGRTVMAESYTVKGGTTEKYINVSSLSSGAYLLQVSLEGGLQKAQKQFIVK